jgi:hypothetical protein
MDVLLRFQILTAMRIEAVVFCDMTACDLVATSPAVIQKLERFLQNIDSCLPNYMVSHPR